MLYQRNASINCDFTRNHVPVMRLCILSRSTQYRPGFGCAVPYLGPRDLLGPGGHARRQIRFRPYRGEFKGARTFGQQAKHLAAVMYDFSASVLGEKAPADTGKLNEGPDSLRTKAEIVAYVKGALPMATRPYSD